MNRLKVQYGERLILLLLATGLGAGCFLSPQHEQATLLPRSFIAQPGDTLYFGHPVPGCRPGERIVEFSDVELADGSTDVYVETDEAGMARLFEFMYPAARSFDEVKDFYTNLLGPATRHYERPAGRCAEWESAHDRFEVCTAREPADGKHGLVIAHLSSPS